MSDPKVEAFFADAKSWPEELAALRAILLSCGLGEEFKWRGPCYTLDGGNVATVWGFKDRPELGFFKGALLADPEGILTRQGENSRAVRVVRFSGLAQIEALEPVLRRYILAAMENERAGLKVDLPQDDLAYPAELVDRLDADPALREAFEALTPGRRRGYVLHVSGAKQAATRAARIEKHAARILAGKGMDDR